MLTCKPVLVPARPLPQQSFEAVTIPTSATTSQQVYHVPDDEIDFATYLQRPLPAGVQNSAGVKWKAHWLAVEGVQPAIPENPPPNARAGRKSSVYPMFKELVLHEMSTAVCDAKDRHLPLLIPTQHPASRPYPKQAPPLSAPPPNPTSHKSSSFTLPASLPHSCRPSTCSRSFRPLPNPMAHYPMRSVSARPR